MGFPQDAWNGVNFMEVEADMVLFQRWALVALLLLDVNLKSQSGCKDALQQAIWVKREFCWAWPNDGKSSDLPAPSNTTGSFTERTPPPWTYMKGFLYVLFMGKHGSDWVEIEWDVCKYDRFWKDYVEWLYGFLLLKCNSFHRPVKENIQTQFRTPVSSPCPPHTIV